MAPTRKLITSIAVVFLAMPVRLPAQTALDRAAPQSPDVPAGIAQGPQLSMRPAAPPSPLQPLLDFKDSDIKFNLATLMNTLRDNRHEGWVLAAYPDPKTSRPLIGAGFSLDLPAREHSQRDPLNPTQFLEPSSAELWEAAGLEPQRLQTMLEQFDRELSAWKKKKFRRKIRTHDLFPEIGEDDAKKLLRISAIQAVHNARAYCRNFDQLNGPQQMALTQLVFQMGVNLEQFTQFLFAINNGPGSVANPPVADVSNVSAGNAAVTPASLNTIAAAPSVQSFASQGMALPQSASESDYWKSVQETLIHSDWARRYSTRAISVIAMFDPAYASAPWEAEARVRAEVHPPRKHRRRAATVRTASAAHHKSSTRHTHKS